MAKLLLILIDAFRHDYFTATHTPFMYTLSKGANSKLESILGYSETVKQSLITGTYPDRNGMWAEYILKSKSINNWIRFLPLDQFTHSFNVSFRHFISTLFKIDIRNIPIPLLEYFDHPLENIQIPTLYEIFLEKEVNFSVYDGPKSRKLLGKISEVDHTFSDFVFVKIPDLDLIGHIYGTHCRHIYRKITEIDKIVNKIVKYFVNIWGNSFDVIIMSDHGMVQVRNYLNLNTYIKRYFKEKRDFIAFYDATIARFWFKRESIKMKVIEILNKLKVGQILDEHLLKHYGVYYPDHRYGELIFLLNPGNVIFPNFYSVLPFPPRGMHGYDPKFDGMFGILLTPNSVLERDQINIVDLFPTILGIFNLSIPDYCQGKSIF